MAHLQIGLWSKVLAPMPRQSDLAAKQNDFKGLLNTTVSSAANATNESGGEAEIAGKGQAGLTGGRERRSLRSPSGRLTAEGRPISWYLTRRVASQFSFLRMSC